LAASHGIATELKGDEIIQGWLGKPKGLLYILWECGWIDPTKKLQKYVKEKKPSWLDSNAW